MVGQLERRYAQPFAVILISVDVAFERGCPRVANQKQLLRVVLKYERNAGSVSCRIVSVSAKNARERVVPGAALNLLDGAMEAAPRPLQAFLQRTMRELTAYLGGEEYLSALKLEATGSQLGLSLLKGLGQFWNFLYRVPGGEPLLYWWGMRSLRRRYSSFGTVSQEHGYGVITHSRDAIAQAMEDGRRKVDAAN